MELGEIEVSLTIDQVRSLARDSILQLRKFTAEIAKLDPESLDSAKTDFLLNALGEEINV